MQGGAPRFAMVAGEASGDLLAGLLLGGMRARWPDLHAGGIGGPRMAERGFDAWWPHEKLAVRGYFEVLRHYPKSSASGGAWPSGCSAARPTCLSASTRPISTSIWKRG